MFVLAELTQGDDLKAELIIKLTEVKSARKSIKYICWNSNIGS